MESDVKGITPVIAIILLLLMAVAAAGGFYFVYQGFTESGEEAGSTQIESLGDQTLSNIKIESAAGGRIYVRNVGATTIDLSKVTVYVENRPISVNRSVDTLAEKERAVLKFTEAPECTADRCEVKISGTASTSQAFGLERLICSSDADCYSGEACDGGVCVEGEEEETDCGNGECEEGEHGYDCWEDCYLESILAIQLNASDGLERYLAVHDWNGSTFDWESNLTVTDHYESDMPMMGEAPDGGLWCISMMDDHHNRWMGFPERQGSAWSYDQNLSSGVGYYDYYFESSDVNSTGGIIGVWENQSFPQTIQWSSVVDWVAQPPAAFAEPSNFVGMLAFGFAPDDKGYLFWGDVPNDQALPFQSNVKYRVWDDGWGSPTILQSYTNKNLDITGISFAENGDGMATWGTINETNHVFLKYATFNDGSWSYQGNFESWTPRNESVTTVDFELVHDHLNNPIQSHVHMVSPSPPVQYTQFMRHANGEWGPAFNLTGDPLSYATFVEMQDGTLLLHYGDMESLPSGQLEHYWTYWNGNAFEPSVKFGYG